MRKPLKNPELPPGAIVETYEDGGALRNDGVTLTPARQNPWYVLATVAGEQEGGLLPPSFPDAELHEKNRRLWNAWMCQGLPDKSRAHLEKKLGLDDGELSELKEDERKEIVAAFQMAFPDAATPESTVIPNPQEAIDFGCTYFEKPICFDRFIFLTNIKCHKAHFSRFVLFSKAYCRQQIAVDKSYFQMGVSFHSSEMEKQLVLDETYFSENLNLSQALLQEGVDFERCVFEGPVEMNSTKFLGVANFKSSRFADVVSFKHAEFRKIAWFDDTIFEKWANFSDGCFKAHTVFDGAVFKDEVPEFFHREMHQGTGFSEDPKLWPDVTEENAQQGKRAYTRLRQVAAEIYDPDLEHFFLRQEMKCKEALAGRFEKGLFVLYRKLADSGISVKRPAAFLAGLWALGAALFAGYFLAPVGHDVPPSVAASPGWSGIGLSFANVFAFLGLSRAFFADVLADLPMCLKYFAGTQTVFGAVFFFLLALGLRNRFRLK